MNIKGLFTQAGYEKKLAFNSQFKLSECSKTQLMLHKVLHCRDSTPIVIQCQKHVEKDSDTKLRTSKKNQDNKTHIQKGIC